MPNRLLAYAAALLAVFTFAWFGLSQLRGQSQPEYSADVVTALNGGQDNAGFARATTVIPFNFPADHAAHPEFQTEWWYNTGNLATADGRRFGIHYTIFRRALLPTAPNRESDWGAGQIYFSDLAIADIEANQFIYYERFARGALGLAGGQPDPEHGVKIWIEDWQIIGTDPQASAFRLKAQQGRIGLDLIIRPSKKPTLQGDRGLSVKSSEPGNASYYYSLTRNQAEGTITVDGEVFPVTGYTWYDHEFSTSVLGDEALGWDWFSIQLDNNRELMLFQIRQRDGGVEPTSHGKLIEADGSSRELSLTDYTITALGQWASTKTGAVYPSGWRVTVNAPSGPIDLTITPLMLNQELNTTTAYWEGASKVSGTDNGQPVGGYGYVELTGYNRALTGQQNDDQGVRR
jgi:predicted secreted hydrolase